jgi:excinuclease ABC subunit C
MARSKTRSRPSRSRRTTEASASARRSARRSAPPPGWTPRITDAESLDAVLARLPDAPGVYLMRDRKGEIVYVGKARRLRARVRQYFSGRDTRQFVPLLAKILGDIETVVTNNAKEALLLENNLIKEHRPRFNVKLRDDSNYLVLRLDPRERWPRLTLVRGIAHDGAHYFGPYHSARSARATLRVVNRHFRLRTCTDYVLERRSRPCLQYQIGRCPAPCVHEVDEGSYEAQVKAVTQFLSGRHKQLVTDLRSRMESAAQHLDFETAARLRDQLTAIEVTLQAQQIVGTASVDQDVVGMYREGGQVEIVIMHVRQGKLLTTQAFSNKGMEHPDPDVLANFLAAYYDRAPFIPDEVLVPHALADDDLAPLEEWLEERKGRKVTIVVPKRGDRARMLALAARNAASSFVTRRNQREDTEAALARLQQRLGLSKLPRVIECFDVSHIQGTDTVASMVVFVDGLPDKSRYRSFKVRGTGSEEGSERLNDDFASMFEVLGRRFRRALEPEPNGDDDAWALPDLVVIDGGKGQLARVLAAMQDLGVPLGAEGVDVVALAKERRDAIGRGRAALKLLEARRAAHSDAPGRTYEDYVVEGSTRALDEEDGDAVAVRPERVYVPRTKDPIVLRPGSSERYLMERVRDEAHRFAITHHRKRRGKRSLQSVLDDIDGVGPALKRALVQHFGSIAAIRRAAPEALSEVRGIGPALARRIHDALSTGG